MVDQRIGRAGVRALDGPATMFASMQDLQKAHAAFVKFCETVDAQLVKHEELANVAFKSVRSIAEIASRIDQIGMSAILLTINARVESAHLGAAGRRFNVIADELRELTKDVKSSSNDIARMSAELMTVIPSIAEHAVRLRESHNQASLDLAVQIAGVSESQRLTLERVEVVVRDGRLRADRVVTQLHEVVGRLQFQDLMSQRITAVANQEIASANLMERALSVAADGGTPESVDFAKQAAAAEHLSHACSPAERAARAGTDGVEDSGLARGETLFF
jgi:methyl-accepting chemotaxis protein